jgi:hypothetical protein
MAERALADLDLWKATAGLPVSSGAVSE